MPTLRERRHLSDAWQ